MLELRYHCIGAPDGDSVEVHELDAEPDAPRVLMLHGLEGSLRSHYVGGVFEAARRRGWGALLLVHRGCGAAPNLARRFYHSGETTDLALVFDRFSDAWPSARWLLAGVSLGGNVMLKWLGERSDAVDPRIVAAAAISVPYDLEAGARKISTGFGRVYDRTFLRSLRRKAIAKLVRYPDLFDRAGLERARTIFDFDDVVTAPVHGFRDAVDYYTKSSSLGFLPGIRVPTFLLSARNDPFLPTPVLERVADIANSNPSLELEVTAQGGHVGFVAGPWPWKPRYYAEERMFAFFDSRMEQTPPHRYD